MEITDLKGIGPVAAERLAEAGVETIDDLAKANVGQLTDAGMSESKAEKLITRAKKRGVVIQTGADVLDDLESREKVTTGMDEVDGILEGGYRRGDIVAISGESSTGKTQMVFYALVKAAEATGLPVVYIETERNRFSPKRLLQFAESAETLSQIHVIKGYDLDQQELAYQKVIDNYDNVGLVVVDSFTANFRLSDEFEGRGTLQSRSTTMARHLRGIISVADELQAPVLITAQVYGNPSAYGAKNATYGGSLFHHTVNFFVQLSNGQGTLSKARITHHPELPTTEFYINIQDDTLEAMRDV